MGRLMWSWVGGLTLAACSPSPRVVDVRGSPENSVVFLIHLDSEDQPQGVEGPFTLNAGGVVERPPESDIEGLFARTEALVVPLDKLARETSSWDKSPRQRRQFRRNAACWVEDRCPLNLLLTPGPMVPRVVRTFGDSVGSIEVRTTPALLSQPTGPDAGWISKLTLRIPFDLELVAKERLRPFGMSEAWAETIVDPLGIRDFVPISRDRVVVISVDKMCLITEDMSLEEICAPGNNTLIANTFAGANPGASFVRAVRAFEMEQPADQVLTIVHGTPNQVVRVVVESDGFGAVAVVRASAQQHLHVAADAGGRVLATIATDAGVAGGTLRSEEYPPGGGQPQVLDVTVNPSTPGRQNSISSSLLVATPAPGRPFIATTKNTLHIRNVNSAFGAQWSAHELFDLGGTVKVRGLGALVYNSEGGTDPALDVFNIWTAHSGGTVYRTLNTTPVLRPMQVDMVFPNEFVDACESAAGLDGNRTNLDFRDLLVRGPHDAFVVPESCALVVWFDALADGDTLEGAVTVFYNEALSEEWPRTSSGEIEQQRLGAEGDHIWVGGGALLRRALRPPL